VKFSIITVVKNNKLQISRTIKSVKDQKYKNFELLIIDGKSKDGTTEIIKKRKKNFKKLKHIIRRDKNLYDGLNYGIKNSKGKYIVILHSGDKFFSKNTLGIINKNILNYDAISGNVLFSKNGKILRYWDYEIKELDKFNAFKIAHTALIVKKEIVKKLNFYNIKYSISSDTDFILRLALIKNLQYKYLNKNIIIMEAGGLSNSFSNFHKKFTQDCIIYFNHFKIFFIFFYLKKIFYKFFKLIKWHILKS
jgi:glycosyltransferase involved in cell wall biosynthesis